MKGEEKMALKAPINTHRRETTVVFDPENNEGKAYSKFPHRFYEPDNIINAGEERFYKINLHKRLV